MHESTKETLVLRTAYALLAHMFTYFTPDNMSFNKMEKHAKN